GLHGVDSWLAAAVQNHFGSLGAALEAAGIDDPGYRKPRKWTPACVIARLRALHRRQTSGAKGARNGRLSYAFVQAADPGLVGAAIRRFGSFRAAVSAAVSHPSGDRT